MSDQSYLDEQIDTVKYRYITTVGSFGPWAFLSVNQQLSIWNCL